MICTLTALYQTQRSVNTAENTLIETKDQFKKINRPFIGITQLEVDSIKAGNPFKMTYVLSNIGNYPVKLLGSKRQLWSDYKVPKWESIKADSIVIDTLGAFVSKDKPVQMDYISTRILSQNEIDLFEKYGHTLYFYGYFDYENLITRDTMSYYFKLKIDHIRRRATLLRSENISIKDRDKME